MKTYFKLFCLTYFLTVLNASGQTYLINFTGFGKSNTVSAIKIENLTQNTSLTLSGNDILSLTITTGIKSADSQSSEIKIYPNPMTGISKLQVTPPVSGDAVITVLDMAGKPVAHIQSFLQNTNQEFQISGLNNGVYLINVKGTGYQFSEKLVCNQKVQGGIKIVKISTDQSIDGKQSNMTAKDLMGVINMAYSAGDRLKFTGISGNYSTVKTDIPTSDKTITFNFMECKDGDNNNYAVVGIGSQFWMAENLKTSKYSNNTPIPLVVNNADWTAITPGFCWYGNNETTYKTPYGGLYNWYSLDPGGNGGKNVCPAGWHVPSDIEWTTLITNLGGESDAGIKLRETGLTHWTNPNTGTNESGFTAISVGDRSAAGVFDVLGHDATWWTATSFNTDNAWFRGISHDISSVNRNYYNKSNGFSVRCVSGDLQLLPSVTTSSTTGITLTTATSGGNITSDGGSPVIARGVCWSTSKYPTIHNSLSSNGTGSGVFSNNLAGLTPSVQYFVRAYATNNAGTAYGNQMSFNTKISDVEGNLYNTVTIGSQVWMAENLKTTKNNDNSPILNVTDKMKWSNIILPAYCWLANDIANKDINGGLYNWQAVNTGKLCPTEWHVPTDDEWSVLTAFLGGENVAGEKLVETSTSHWQDTTNIIYEAGFAAVKDGYRDEGPMSPGSPGAYFVPIGRYFWSSTRADVSDIWYRQLLGNTIVRRVYQSHFGFSIRCLSGFGLPILNSIVVSTVTQNSATIEGSILSDGGALVTERGVCWNTSSGPTTSNNKTTDGAGTGTFSSKMTGLSLGSTYYVRPYATNSTGTAYGSEIIITTTVAVGDSYQGGIVGYILQPCDPGYITGQTHGFIVVPADQIAVAPFGYASMPVLGTALGTGNENTNTIFTLFGGGTAAGICYNLILNGYSDWYLPSKDELNKFYLNRSAIGGFDYETWLNSSNGWVQNFVTGVQDGGIGYNPYFFRPVRSF